MRSLVIRETTYAGTELQRSTPQQGCPKRHQGSRLRETNTHPGPINHAPPRRQGRDRPGPDRDRQDGGFRHPNGGKHRSQR